MCFNAHDGETLYINKGGRAFGLASDNKVIYIKASDGTAMAINTQGVIDYETAIWKVETGMGKDVGTTSLCICDDLLLIPSDKGCLYAFDAKNGAPLWIHKVGIGVVNPVKAWKSKGKVFILASTMDGKMELLTLK